MQSLMRRIVRKLKTWSWMLSVRMLPKSYGDKHNMVVLFDPSIDSLNMGDSIIRCYCHRALEDVLADKDVLSLPTHKQPTEEEISAAAHSAVKIVCGTNLMSPHFEEFSNWKIPKDLHSYRDIVTLGVGWGYYCDDISPTSKFVYNTILSKNKLLSVRDSYTEKKFREMGFSNVVNTGCPTLWGLSPEHCAAIPQSKSSRVITTLTDYSRDHDMDLQMLNILQKCYDEVYVWIQGANDMEYLNELTDTSSINIIPGDFNAYTKALMMGDVDYAGTRLHAGIHAMNLGVRSIIIAVDNRAVEMGKDFNLPVISRADLEKKLMESVLGSWPTQITLPYDEINKWKAQFVNGKD